MHPKRKVRKVTSADSPSNHNNHELQNVGALELQSFPLLHLPRELRDKIYYFVLVAKRAIKCRPPPSDTCEQSPEDATRRVETQIFRTSKQIFTEAHDVHLKQNTFRFEPWYAFPSWKHVYDSLKQAQRIKADVTYEHEYKALTEFLTVHSGTLNVLRVGINAVQHSHLREHRRFLQTVRHVKVRRGIELRVSFTVRSFQIGGFLTSKNKEPDDYTREEKQFCRFVNDLERKMLCQGGQICDSEWMWENLE